MTSQTRPLAHQLRRQLLAQPELYVESVGKPDMLTLNDVGQASDGAGTVIRLVMGATTLMPLRALTYVDAAIRIAQVIPYAQLQIVHTNEIGSKINAINRERSRQEAILLAEATRRHVQTYHPFMLDRLFHAEDGQIDFERYIEPVRAALDVRPDVAERLQANGFDHRGDTLRYAAAHVALHDTDSLVLEPLLPDAPAQTPAERVISVGSQSERPFYAARMVVRQCYYPEFVATAQIFTKHVSAPYFRRNLEQTLAEGLRSGVQPDVGGDRATQRDVEHFLAHQGEPHA